MAEKLDVGKRRLFCRVYRNSDGKFLGELIMEDALRLMPLERPKGFTHSPVRIETVITDAVTTPLRRTIERGRNR